MFGHSLCECIGIWPTFEDFIRNQLAGIVRQCSVVNDQEDDGYGDGDGDGGKQAVVAWSGEESSRERLLYGWLASGN